MPPLNKYSYQALSNADTIRLVVLEPARSEAAPLKCSIATTSLAQQHLEYYAVSYFWGDQQVTQPLEIRDQAGHTSHLRVTPNVDEVLRRFRSPKGQQRLWIDAVCINQDDELEKAQQIPEMGRIYGQAKEVFIWLGPGHFHTGLTMSFLRQVNELPECPKLRMVNQMLVCLKATFGVDEGIEALGPLGEYFELPWFSRRWIIQEACLARRATVHCGKHSIPLGELAVAASRFQLFDMSDYHFKMAASLGAVIAATVARSSTLLELLWNFYNAKCKDRRDRIAALLCLVPAEKRFPIDYSAHWAELYKQAACFVMKTSTDHIRLQLLLHLVEFGPLKHAKGVNSSQCPSWIPDWSKSRVRKLPYHSEIRNVDTDEPYPASPGYPALVGLSFAPPSNLRMHCNLSMAGRVRTTASYLGKAVPRDCKQMARRVVSVLQETFPPKDQPSAPRMLALSSLVNFVVKFRHSKEDRPFETEVLDRYLRRICRMSAGRITMDSLSPLKSLHSLLQKFSLFTLQPLESGSVLCPHTGIGPPGMTTGDVLVPIWRPNWTSDEHFSYMAEEEPTVVNAVTMLVIRPIAGGLSKAEGLRGEIVGQALCAFSTGTQCEGPVSGGPTWDELSVLEQGSSMVVTLV